MYEHLTRNLDSSYTFIKNGFPYNCPNSGEWINEYKQVHAYALEHPNEVAHQYPITPPSLDELKNKKMYLLSDSFNDRVNGSFITSQGYIMQFSPEDTIKIQGAILLMEKNGESSGYLVQADDMLIQDVSLETIKEVFAEMLDAYSQCYAKKQEYRAAIRECSTEKDLDNIVFQWPI